MQENQAKTAAQNQTTRVCLPRFHLSCLILLQTNVVIQHSHKHNIYEYGECDGMPIYELMEYHTRCNYIMEYNEEIRRGGENPVHISYSERHQKGDIISTYHNFVIQMNMLL